MIFCNYFSLLLYVNIQRLYIVDKLWIISDPVDNSVDNPWGYPQPGPRVLVTPASIQNYKKDQNIQKYT